MNFRRVISYIIFLSLYFFTTQLYGQVVINEVLISPPAYSGSTTNDNSLYNTNPGDQPPYNAEWIELYNRHPCDSADLSCFTLGSNMQPLGAGYLNWGAFTFPPGTRIPPLGFLLIGGNFAQVPHLDFNIGFYRNTTFGTQWLDGDSSRWFLRDEYGWLALYNPAGNPVDAVYWDLYGNPGNLSTQEEYAHNIVTHTTCSGTKTLAAAKNIAGIEYAGQTVSASYLSFQRTIDGVNNWYATEVTPTPGACNGNCVGPPKVHCAVTNVSCGGHNGKITVGITDGYTGPYTIQWIIPSGGNHQTITNLDSGTYIVKVTDAYNCFIVYDTAKVLFFSNPVISIDTTGNEVCTKANGFIHTLTSGGTLPLTYNWNTNPPQTTQNIENLHAGSYTVTVTDAGGCTASASAIITDTPPPSVSFIDVADDTCFKGNGSATLLIEGGHPQYSYTWEQFPAEQSLTINNLTEGTYTVSVTDSICSVLDSVVIKNIPGPVAAFRVYPVATTIEDPRFIFYDESIGATEYYWDFGDLSYSDFESPVHVYKDTGTYRVLLTVHDKSGCMDSVSHNALILDITLFIPNAFTPDNNGLNDEFHVFGQNIGDFKIMIFDRWGEEVFTSTDIGQGWDGSINGKIAPGGVYSWVIWYREDYRLFQMDQKKITGHVTLLR